jgi:hypothetical protein
MVGIWEDYWWQRDLIHYLPCQLKVFLKKEVESAPLKERKEELKIDAKKVYGIEPKEQPKGEDGKVKEKPKAVQTESSQKFLDELDKPKEKEVQNAESNGDKKDGKKR